MYRLDISKTTAYWYMWGRMDWSLQKTFTVGDKCELKVEEYKGSFLLNMVSSPYVPAKTLAYFPVATTVVVYIDDYRGAF